MATRRQHRYNELLLEEISLLIPGRLGDEDLSDITVTRVEATQDLSSAKVYFSVIAPEGPEALQEAGERLESVKGMIMDELSTLGLRRIPRLSFSYDKAQESGQRVLDILRDLRVAERPAEDPEVGSDAAL